MSRRDPTNFLWPIIDEADRLLHLVEPQAVKRDEAYRTNVVLRAVDNDVVARVKAIAAAYDRLCQLNQEIATQHETGLSELRRIGDHTYEVTREDIEDSEHLWAEVDVATSFILYELDSLTTILERQLAIAIAPGSEIHYAIKIRDRLLAHPQLDGLMRIPARGGSFGGSGPVTLDAGLSSRFPDRYLAAGITDMASIPDEKEIARIRRENEAIILSKKRNERLEENEIQNLLAFGARGPNLVAALADLASLLSQRVLPLVGEHCDEGIGFGLERWPVDLQVRRSVFP